MDYYSRVIDTVKLAWEVINSNPFKTGAGFAAAGVYSLFAPRVGFGRAFTLALKSKVKGVSVKSARADVMAQIESHLQSVEKGNFIVVHGMRAIGKTTAINTVLSHTCGVTHVEVLAGASADKIIADASKKISGVKIGVQGFDYVPSAERVAGWYNTIFRSSPIVVLHAATVRVGNPHANIVPAARALSANGIKVLIDASENALDTSDSDRTNFINVLPMPRAMLEQIPNIIPVIDKLKSEHLDDVMWYVCGGRPTQYTTTLKEGLKHDNFRQAVIAHLSKVISDSIEEVIKFIESGDKAAKIIDAIQKSDNLEITAGSVGSLPVPNKVLRKVMKKGSTKQVAIVVPATSAMKLVLKYNWTETPDIDELIAIAKQIKEKEEKDHAVNVNEQMK